ncbi:hypothetical protein DL771_008541 [Monosporascus sp. 5C6A]|nr:hypothetical protein DL771_008541 [Monosporascus sp. 5C6A]
METLRHAWQFLSGAKKDPTSKPPYLLKQRSSTFFIILTVSLAIFTDIFYYALVIPVIPFSLTVQVGTPEDEVQRWTSILLACYSLALFVGAPISGIYADHTSSRRWPLLIGLVMLAGSTVLLCFGTTIALLVLGRILQGLSAGIVWSVGCALLVDTMGHAVGVAMGYVNTSLSLGLLIAPAIGGAVYEAAGYYAVFYISFGIVGVDILLRLAMIEKKVAKQWLPEEDSSTCERLPEPDVEKAAHAPTTDADRRTNSDASNGTLPAPAGNGTTGEPRQRITAEDKSQEDSTAGRADDTAHPSSTQHWRKKDAALVLIKSPRLLAALYGMFAQAGLMMGFDAVLALFVQDTFHWTSTAAGIVFLAIFLPGFISPLVGWLSDRYGPKWLSLGGFCASVPLLVCLRFVDGDSVGDKVLLCFLLALLGCAFSFSGTPLMAEISYVIESLAARHPGIFGEKGVYGLGYGLFTMSFALGGTIGPLWSGYVVAGAGWGTLGWSFAIWAASAAVVVVVWLEPGNQKSAAETSNPAGDTAGT